jgi:hypothetical protein
VRRKREAWFDAQPDLDPERLVFIDETGASTKMARRDCADAPRKASAAGRRSRMGTRKQRPLPAHFACRA